MAQQKKLQVFISSTFSDLKEERQAAVEAILTAGHIPAGMELFTAGDESQMNVIKRWIDESDIYLLILGSRYGSIEPISGKSYTQLEYEYAIEKSKPFFSVAIQDSAIDKRIRKGKAYIEMENPAALKDFRAVVTSKVVRFWEDARDIKIAILETISEFSRREELAGWIPGNEAVNSLVLAEEIVRLTKEVSRLSKENSELKNKSKNNQSLGKIIDPSFERDYALLNSYQTYEFITDSKLKALLTNIANIFGDSEYTLLHYFWYLNESQKNNAKVVPDSISFEELIYKPLRILEYVDYSEQKDGMFRFRLTSIASSFFLKLRLHRNINEAEKAYRKFREK